MAASDTRVRSPWRLVCDLGGTNVRFARADGSELSHHWSAPLADHSGFEEALGVALDRMSAGSPDSIAIGAAGPVDGDTISLTNASWVLEAGPISRACGGADVLFFNDLQPVARAIPALALTDFTTLRAGASVTGAARLAINVGTGFGAAVLQQTAPHECGGGFLSFPTEAGHMTLPHALALDAPEVKGLGATLEDILSGSGVLSLYHHLAGSDHPSAQGQTPSSAAQVFDSATTDPISARSCDLFGYGLGLAVRDLILAHAAWGGVFLFGSVVHGWVEAGRLASFQQGLCASGALGAPGVIEERIARVPVHNITRDDAALLGLALL
jgi:glucokinase